MEKKKIEIAVVDDQLLFRKGLISLLKRYDKFNICMEAENGEGFIKLVENSKPPQVVLLDLEMPGLDGIAVTKYLRTKKFPIKVIILTMHDDDEFVVHLMEKGANAFLLKNTEPEVLIDAIHSVVENDYYIEDWVNQVLLKNLVKEGKIQPAFKTVQFSPTELEIIKLICDGKSSREISESLKLSQRTVENNRLRIMDKINVRNTAGLIMYAVKNKLVT